MDLLGTIARAVGLFGALGWLGVSRRRSTSRGGPFCTRIIGMVATSLLIMVIGVAASAMSWAQAACGTAC